MFFTDASGAPGTDATAGTGVLQERFGASRLEVFVVQLRALGRVEVDGREGRNAAVRVLRGDAVARAFEFVFGFDRSTLAVEVPGAGDARDRDGLGRE